MYKYLYIIGLGSNSFVVSELASMLGYENIAFVGDKEFNTCPTRYVFPFKKLTSLISHDSAFAISFGDPNMRHYYYRMLFKLNANLPSLIHPTAFISNSSIISNGSIINAFVNVSPFSNIGQCALINNNVNVDHHCNVSSFTHLCPSSSIAGNVNIGQSCLIGSGSTIIENLNICDDVIIGAGSCVLKDITSPGTYVNKSLSSLSKI